MGIVFGLEKGASPVSSHAVPYCDCGTHRESRCRLTMPSPNCAGQALSTELDVVGAHVFAQPVARGPQTPLSPTTPLSPKSQAVDHTEVREGWFTHYDDILMTQDHRYFVLEPTQRTITWYHKVKHGTPVDKEGTIDISGDLAVTVDQTYLVIVRRRCNRWEGCGAAYRTRP